MIENTILKEFSKDRSLYDKYNSSINKSYLKENYNTLFRMFKSLEDYYTKHKEAPSIKKEELDLNYQALYQVQDRESYDKVLDKVFSSEEVNSDVLLENLNKHKTRAVAGELARLSLDYEIGRITKEELDSAITDYSTIEDVSLEDDDTAVAMNLSDLHVNQFQKQGLRWRLNWLNKSLGSIRKGDFGFILARPEAGKTTFLVSEVSHMAQNTDKTIYYFNNEEQSEKVAIRMYQSVLGLTTAELFADLEGNQAKYEELVGDRIKILGFEESSSMGQIEKVLSGKEVGLIVIDQIDKITTNSKADRYDLQLKAIYNWARQLASRYAPVIAVSQAGGTGEGKLFLDMNDVDSSKTAKQGEADFILGIGKESDNTSRVRYFNISKNKLSGDEDTDPTMRHGSGQVIIQPEIARYSDS